MTKKANTAASKGGRKRAEALSSDDRAEIAKRAADARWKVQAATHSGFLSIADKEIECAVLEDGTRLLTQETFLTSIGRARKARAGTGSSLMKKGDLPPFLAENLRPFVPKDMVKTLKPIKFRNQSGNRGWGYDAKLLPKVCEIYLRARDAGEILPSQRHLVQACDALIRGLAQVGIIALVDEATGYQEERERDELQRLLAKYISEEFRPWVNTFPMEFFRQVYRIHNWEFKGGHQHSPYIGKFINEYIYGEFPEGALERLRELNPKTKKGWRRRKHHQHLTVDTGAPHLDSQILKVITVMQVSQNKDEFVSNFNRMKATMVNDH